MMLDLLGIGDIGSLVALVGAALAAVWAVFSAGKRSARKQREIDDLKQREKDRAKLDAIEPSSELDAVDRLRNNGF